MAPEQPPRRAVRSILVLQCSFPTRPHGLSCAILALRGVPLPYAVTGTFGWGMASDTHTGRQVVGCACQVVGGSW